MCVKGRRGYSWWIAATGAVFALAGCQDDRALVIQLQRQADALTADNERCKQELADRDAQIAALRRRIENEPYLQGIVLDDLFLVDRITLESRTGGVDLDGQPGDDGVVVYIQPRDADRDMLKAAGQITVQLLDLTAPGAPRELATYVFNDRETLRKSWYGGLLTDHYTLKCAFPPLALNTVPREVHVRVTFLDYLTGREFVASTTVPIQRVDSGNALVPRTPGA